jgi:hypothetical protein
MAHVKLALVLLDQDDPDEGAFHKGINILSGLTRKGRPLRKYFRTVTPQEVKVVEGEDLLDEVVIFRHALEEYRKIAGDRINLNRIELPVLHYEHSGIKCVAVMVLCRLL